VTNALFDPGREGFLSGEIDWDTATVKAVAVEGYTFDAAHKFTSDVTGAGGTILATSTALASKTVTSGVAGASNPNFVGTANGGSLASGHTIGCFLLAQTSAVAGGADVAASAQRLILHLDGRVAVTCASSVSGGATSIPIDPLGQDLANGSTVVFGAVTATLTTGASRGDRALTVSSLSGGVAAGTAGVSSPQGNMPVATNGGDVLLQLGTVAGILAFKL
jgi:hypothetical protein